MAERAEPRGAHPGGTLVSGVASPQAARYLALGDSYTVGEGVPPRLSWPAQLAALARSRGSAISPPRIIAATGWTTDELDAAIDAAPPDVGFELVTLLIGVNDQYRGRDTDRYRAAFERLLTRAVGFAGGRPERVIVGSIPDWGVTPYARDRDSSAVAVAVDAFNAINRAAASTAGARYVDVTTISRERGSEPEMLAGDGLHPSGAMYAEWAALTLPVALEVIGGR